VAGTSCLGSLLGSFPVAVGQHTQLICSGEVTYLEDDELIDWHGTSSNSLAERRKVVVDVADHILRRFT
jgi:hypothetical protein